MCKKHYNPDIGHEPAAKLIGFIGYGVNFASNIIRTNIPDVGVDFVYI